MTEQPEKEGIRAHAVVGRGGKCGGGEGEEAGDACEKEGLGRGEQATPRSMPSLTTPLLATPQLSIAPLSTARARCI